MSTERLRRVLELYRNYGPIHLYKESFNYLSNVVLQGGLSSRPMIENISGVFRPALNFLFNIRYGSGIDVCSEDWDNLVLLDACRFDDYERVCDIDGQVEARISRGADSRRFIENNFQGRELHDVVCITANPHYEMMAEDVFHSLITSPIQNWDSDLQCVPPSSVTEAAIKANDEFPNKRLLIHYMQPHDPPLGPTADQIKNDLDLGGPTPLGGGSGDPRLMEAVAAGHISVERARQAYRETLDTVLGEVEELIEELPGKTVISSDHGEMFGEKPYPLLGNLYEHYQHPRTLELCKVPWHIVEGHDTRKKITSDPPRSISDVSEEMINEQLESLGYK